MSTTETAATETPLDTAAEAKPTGPEPIPLDTPIKRGKTEITEITLRKPNSGELRGVALSDLLRLDTGALITVLPRISTPSLTKQEAASLDPADMLTLGSEVANFLLSKATRREHSLD